MDIVLTDIVQEPPCGPNLEHAPEFIALEKAARGKPERVLGDKTIKAEPPNWAEVKNQAEALLARTTDLRVAILLTRALTRIEDIPGLRSGLKLIHAMCDQYWDHLHPRFDPDDNDPTMRSNALAALADSEGLLRDIRDAFIIRPGKHGRVSARETLIALGKLPPGSGEVASQSQIEAVIRAAAVENAAPIEAVRESIGLVNALNALLSSRLGSESAPDLKPLTDMLNALNQVCGKTLDADSPGVQGNSGGAQQPASSADIRTREDAIRLLDKVCDFVERTEPAHPAPLLIRRAQRLMSKNFVEIIQDLAPDSLGQIQKIAGIKEG